MKSRQNILVTTGLFLVLAGMVFGAWHSLSAQHQARLTAHDAYQPVFEKIIDADESWRQDEARITQHSIKHRRATDTHGHSINMGILVILIGLLTPLFSRAGSHMSRPGNLLIKSLAIFAAVYPLGLLLQYFTFNQAGELVAAIGALGAIISLVILYARFWKAINALVMGSE